MLRQFNTRATTTDVILISYFFSELLDDCSRFYFQCLRGERKFMEISAHERLKMFVTRQRWQCFISGEVQSLKLSRVTTAAT